MAAAAGAKEGACGGIAHAAAAPFPTKSRHTPREDALRAFARAMTAESMAHSNAMNSFNNESGWDFQTVIASEAKQSIARQKRSWIASSLPLLAMTVIRNDVAPSRRGFAISRRAAPEDCYQSFGNGGELPLPLW
jgi:hypothetical protein